MALCSLPREHLVKNHRVMARTILKRDHFEQFSGVLAQGLSLRAKMARQDLRCSRQKRSRATIGVMAVWMFAHQSHWRQIRSVQCKMYARHLPRLQSAHEIFITKTLKRHQKDIPPCIIRTVKRVTSTKGDGNVQVIDCRRRKRHQRNNT